MLPVSQSVQDAAEFWAASLRINNYLVLVAFTILYYDFLLTFFDEFRYFWKTARLSTASVLFVVVRYYGLLGTAPLFVEYFGDIPEHRCRQLQTYHQAFATSSQAIIAMRTYALYERSKKILQLLIVSHLGGIVAYAAAFFTTKSPLHTVTARPFTSTGCDLSLTNEQGIHLVIAWGAMLWFDSTIFILTLVQALRIGRSLPGGLLETMFRDGTMLYGIMVASIVSNIVTFMVTPSGSPLKGMDTTLTNVLFTTLTARIMLNLRDPALCRLPRSAVSNISDGWNDTIAALPTISSLRFRRYSGTGTPVEAGVIDTRATRLFGVSSDSCNNPDCAYGEEATDRYIRE